MRAVWMVVAALAASPALAQQAEQQLPEVKVRAAPVEESPTGPDQGYRPGRSATATKTDTPLHEAAQSLLAALAVIFTGHGVAALQEAGALGTTALGFEPLPLLGIYPSGEALGAQLAALALVAAGAWSARRAAAAV